MTQNFSQDSPVPPLLATRRHTAGVTVSSGMDPQHRVQIGGRAPVVVQSMTSVDTADSKAAAAEIIQLWQAGSELVRLTVNNEPAAAAIPEIAELMAKAGCTVPLIGDFHYNGHLLLEKFPAMARLLGKYRINPGNVGFKDKRDRNFAAIIELAMKYGKKIRIGANWGSMDQAVLAGIMDQAQTLSREGKNIKNSDLVSWALIKSALDSAEYAIHLGMRKEDIVISCKVSKVPDLVYVYRLLAGQTDLPLHLGLTEAGMDIAGLASSSVALGILLSEGIGDTVRVSLTPQPGSPRHREVRAAQEILQALGLRQFAPKVTACPGCGRTSSNFFQHLAMTIESFTRESMPRWQLEYPKIFIDQNGRTRSVSSLEVAVMGCIVNGPGESKHADLGISLPGNGEESACVVFIDGKKSTTLRYSDQAGQEISQQFCQIIENYVAEKFSL